jgi:hypothetical protein
VVEKNQKRHWDIPKTSTTGRKKKHSIKVIKSEK